MLFCYGLDNEAIAEIQSQQKKSKKNLIVLEYFVFLQPLFKNR